MAEEKSQYLELKPIELANINNGDLVAQINHSIERVTKDIVQRPLVRKPRKIMVEICIAPPLEQDPMKISEYSYLVQEKIPAHRGFKGAAALRDGALQLHEFPSENVNQTVLQFPAAKG